MKLTLKIVALAVVLYLMGAFIAGDFNSVNWHKMGKLIGCFLFVMSTLCVAMDHEDNKS